MADRQWRRELTRPAPSSVEPVPPAAPDIDGGDITSGIIDPDRLGTGATGAGTRYLADDGTWKVVSGGGGGGNSYFPSGW